MMNKRFACLICVIFMLLTLTGSITAAYVNLNENQSIEVIFKEDSVFSEEQRQMIIAHFNETDSSEDTVYGLKCTLFGHSYVAEVVKQSCTRLELLLQDVMKNFMKSKFAKIVLIEKLHW